MHKRLVNEVEIALSIRPDGPILIKGSDSQADPTRPDMSFVRTRHNGRETVYLPGSSLKGVLRAHCEKLARTVQGERSQPLACDPLGADACGQRLERDKTLTGPQAHARSCFVCQLFGNTALGSHLRLADAYPDAPPPTEERTGVAIDRVFGSVSVGPFNYEAVTEGRFRTSLRLRNVSLAHLGLLALVLRDLTDGRIRVGFGKSRGQGAIKATVDALAVRYPSCDLTADGRLYPLGGSALEAGTLFGAGVFVSPSEGYGYPASDAAPLPPGHAYAPEDWLGVVVTAPMKEAPEEGADWHPLGRLLAGRWKEAVANVQ